VKRSIDYYCALGLKLEWDAAPHFAMLRVGDSNGGTLGLLSFADAQAEGVTEIGPLQARGLHVELSTDDLDALYSEFVAKNIVIDVPPHEEKWERAMTAFDPDGYSVEFSEGRRGKQQASLGRTAQPESFDVSTS